MLKRFAEIDFCHFQIDNIQLINIDEMHESVFIIANWPEIDRRQYYHGEDEEEVKHAIDTSAHKKDRNKKQTQAQTHFTRSKTADNEN